MLDVNDTSHTGGNASNNPDSFKINNGATVYTTATAVNAGDTIHLMNAGTNTATFVVPVELAATKLASTTDAGEYIKLDLDLFKPRPKNRLLRVSNIVTFNGKCGVVNKLKKFGLFLCRIANLEPF